MNTLLPALKVLCVEGMSKESPVKIRRAVKEIERDSRRHGWTDDTIEMMPNEWQHRLCCARLQNGNLDWRGWQWRNPRAGHDPFKIPRWKLGLPIYPIEHECKEPERVKHLLIYSEQGCGDQLMFAIAFNRVKEYAEEVTIEVEPRLAPIFRRTFPDFNIYPLKDLRDGSWVKEGQFDAKVLMGTVVARFLRSKEDFKQIKMTADPEMVEKWSCYKGMTGFSFHGNQADLDYKLFPEDWINLQYGDNKGHGIVPDINLKEDIEDIFGILANLEKVVTVPNTLSHMAGVLDIPTDVICTPGHGDINNACNWRWGNPEDRTMIWHPSIKIFRNPSQFIAENRGFRGIQT